MKRDRKFLDCKRFLRKETVLKFGSLLSHQCICFIYFAHCFLLWNKMDDFSCSIFQRAWRSGTRTVIVEAIELLGGFSYVSFSFFSLWWRTFTSWYRGQSGVDFDICEAYFTFLISSRYCLSKKAYCHSSLASSFADFLKRVLAVRKGCAPVKWEIFIQVHGLFSKQHFQVLSPTLELAKARWTVWWALPSFLSPPRYRGSYGQRWIICIRFLLFLICSHAFTIYVCCTGERQHTLCKVLYHIISLLKLEWEARWAY